MCYGAYVRDDWRFRVSMKASLNAASTRAVCAKILRDAAMRNIVVYWKDALSPAAPMMFIPLSTYTVAPVMPEASGEHKKAVALPISMALSGFSLSGALLKE